MVLYNRTHLTSEEKIQNPILVVLYNRTYLTSEEKIQNPILVLLYNRTLNLRRKDSEPCIGVVV